MKPYSSTNGSDRGKFVIVHLIRPHYNLTPCITFTDEDLGLPRSTDKCSVTFDSGRDHIRVVCIVGTNYCSEPPKFLPHVHLHIGRHYRRPLPSPGNIGLGSLWVLISSTFVSNLGSTLISNISRQSSSLPEHTRNFSSKNSTNDD